MKGKIVFIVMAMYCFIFAFSDMNADALSSEDQSDSQIVSAHTSGMISRESMIQVQFAAEMVDSEKLSIPLETSPLTFKPEIKGTAIWKTRQSLEFRPGDKLPAGQSYTATLNLSEITKTPGTPETFEFSFTAMKQAYEIKVDGLRAASRTDLRKLELTGSLSTADSEKSANIIKLLRASQDGNGLNIRWTHSKDRRSHAFVIADIQRSNTPSEVLLQWDGTPVGVDKRGKRTVQVPPVGPFKVMDIRAIHGEQQYIEIRFTDPVEKEQDLNGLIHLGDEKRKLRFTIDGSIVRVYSTSQWPKEVVVNTEPGIRNILRARLGTKKTATVTFEDIKPEVKFVGKRVILPTSSGLTIPVEAVNLTTIIVEATKVYEKNMPQFFQVNDLEGNEELKRVGRIVWKKAISLGFTPDKRNQRIRYGLDVSPLIRNYPGGGFFRLRLSFGPEHIVYPCPNAPNGRKKNSELSADAWEDEEESSSWDAYEEDDEYYYNGWDERENPCHSGYYREFSEHNITVARNVLISDIGLIAKRGADHSLTAFATDIKTAKPMPDVSLTLMDYQQQILATGKTDRNGMVVLDSARRKPFLIVANNGDHRGYLRLDDGSALSVSHFDVAGETVKKGLKGFIYGERGVWRPGDPIYLTFILMDNDKRLPKDHPIFFELRNPENQVIQSVKTKASLNGFYSFKTKTDPDAPTGNWTARVRAGGALFEKVLKIETVRPNRLKINIDFGQKYLSSGKIAAELSSRWLHGAIAKDLKADVELRFTAVSTRFPRYEEYVFDDPVREYETEAEELFKGELNDEGKVTITADINAENESPGMLMANFKTRVFEPGGAFSTDRFSIPYHPYDRYVGLRLPKGDKARGMLLTDIPHTVRIAMLDHEGEPLPEGAAEIKLYKIKWRWWWEKGDEYLSEYVSSSDYEPIKTDTVQIRDGKAEWQFEIKYPSWGRYLVRAKDLNGNHYTGKIFYVDWPGWAGRAQKDIPGAATVLSFSSDKASYRVGEKVTLTIPTGKTGRGLVSIESGSNVIQTEWIKARGAHTRYTFTASEKMSPNVYAHVTFLQPHKQMENDLPIRMYGVIPIKVENPATRLTPRISTPESFVPEETAQITIREANGKPMTYTVAVVDEGLLDLTRFKTPDPRSHFYKREALGIKTWDLFDRVAGAYSGVLEQLLAIGGDEGLINKGKKKAHRFPPMVRFMGPFELKTDQENTHNIEIPQYVGSVRVMVVAGQNGAFGAAEKAVFVRKPLMVLATLPRVLGPDEEVEMPISVFAMDDTVKNVSMTVQTQGPLSVTGSPEQSIAFSEPGDDIITFRLKAGSQVGVASATVRATAGQVTAGQTIEIDIRMPGGPVVDVLDTVISKDEMWKQAVRFPGAATTNKITLEVSRIPPLNLGKRLGFLVRYPHGCVEQTTSSVFPQLYLKQLLDLSPEKQDKIQQNIRAGIDRLRTFQAADGGFLYWPGQGSSHDWSSNYAGHFLLEAEKAGYLIPPGIISRWKTYQRKRAASWALGGARSELIQAYRLYTLALAGAAELGAMNRLREHSELPSAAQWRLAAAYQLAGHPEAAEDLAERAGISVSPYQELSNTYGSDLRDRAMMLESLCLMNRMKQAMPLAKAISEELGSNRRLNTQATAYALIAMARHAGIAGGSDEMAFAFVWNDGEEERVSSVHPLVQRSLKAGDKTAGVIMVRNMGAVMIYPRVILEGIPAIGTETAASNGMSIGVKYLTLKGNPLDHRRLDQGTDFAAEVTIKHTGTGGDYKEMALSHLFPSGWEIRNMRMEAPEDASEYVPDSDYEYQDIRDDRVYTYFDIRQGETKTFRILLNASYLGRFYLPMVLAEAMYDPTINARIPGEWVTVDVLGGQNAVAIRSASIGMR